MECFFLLAVICVFGVEMATAQFRESKRPLFYDGWLGDLIQAQENQRVPSRPTYGYDTGVNTIENSKYDKQFDNPYGESWITWTNRMKQESEENKLNKWNCQDQGVREFIVSVEARQKRQAEDAERVRRDARKAGFKGGMPGGGRGGEGGMPGPPGPPGGGEPEMPQPGSGMPVGPADIMGNIPFVGEMMGK